MLKSTLKIPIIYSAHGVNLDRRMMDKILYVWLIRHYTPLKYNSLPVDRA